MGLDTYAYHKNAEGEFVGMPDSLFAHIPPVLCGGIFSGNSGDGCGSSFRGKVYAGFLHNTIGLDLYQEEIPTATVQAAADALDKWILENGELEFSDISSAEIQALAQWFRVVATGEGVVVGWW